MASPGHANMPHIRGGWGVRPAYRSSAGGDDQRGGQSNVVGQVARTTRQRLLPGGHQFGPGDPDRRVDQDEVDAPRGPAGSEELGVERGWAGTSERVDQPRVGEEVP